MLRRENNTGKVQRPNLQLNSHNDVVPFISHHSFGKNLIRTKIPSQNGEKFNQLKGSKLYVEYFILKNFVLQFSNNFTVLLFEKLNSSFKNKIS